MKIESIIPIVMGVVAVLAVMFKSELKAAVFTTLMQFSLYANNYFFVSLFFNGFSGSKYPNPFLPSLEMGSLNLLKLKLIYVARYVFEDQFLLQDMVDVINVDIEKRLHDQYAANNWRPHHFDNVPVPSAKWGQISEDDIFEKFILPGIPFILKNVPSQARDKWTPEYFAQKYGSHNVDVINTHALSVLNMNISRYVDAHRPEGDEERGQATWYIRALSDIFDSHPDLLEEVGPHMFDNTVKSRYITSQIFIGMVKASGTSYHCANFNNIFFQINGRKKWTFVSPQYNALMYPMFNKKAMDVASFLTTIALNNSDAMETAFPLYKYAPKMTGVLEPGDVLFNPPWQWHMIDNLEDVSIGVATRWFLAPGQQYQNTVHSTLQFLSSYIWSLYYSKMYNLENGVRAHKASNTPPIDERFNFGKTGSAAAYRPRIFPASTYDSEK